MFGSKYFSLGSGIAAAGAVALLATHYGSLGATTEQPTAREFRPAAQPIDIDYTKIYPWAAGSAPVGTAGAATVTVFKDSTALLTSAALQTANEVGPLTFDLNSIKAFSANQAPPGSTAGTVNYTDMNEWTTGIAGLASSTGALGLAENGVSYDPYVGTHTGVLQTANNFGPAFFNLNVLKAIGFTQAPTGAVLTSGQPDNFSAVDIGRWSAGIPGVITNTGTTGFVTYQDFGNGPISDFRMGGLHTTTQIGSATFDFNFLPAISTGILPPSIAFSFAPDMTAVNTPFAANTPPTPGVVQPFGGLPVPATVASKPAPTKAVPQISDVQPARIADTEPDVAIPGVNGVPLAKTPKTDSEGGGQNPTNPFKPFQAATDAITSGIRTVTGQNPTGGGSTGDTSSGAGSGSNDG